MYKLKFWYGHSKLLTFSNQDFWSRFFLFIITIIIWLCIMSIFGAGILERIINPVKFVNPAQLFVEIYPDPIAINDKYKKDIVIEYLKQAKEVKDVNVIPVEEIVTLIQNWTGLRDEILNLPLPTIIGVTLHKDAQINIKKLEQDLQSKVKNVFLETEQDVIKRIALPLSAAKTLSLLVPVISIIIMLCVILLIVLALLYAHRSSIEVLYVLGTSNLRIATEFTIWIFKKTFIGSFLGLSLGLLMVTFFSFLFDSVSILFPTYDTLLLIISMLVVCPFFASITTLICVRKIINWIV